MDYEEILRIIIQEFGITEELFYHSTKRDCTDARALLVHTLIEEGHSERGVCRLTGFSQQRVNYLKNTFRYRRSLYLTNTLQTLHKRLSLTGRDD